MTVEGGEDVKKEEHSSIVRGIAIWYNHSGNQSGDSSENWTFYLLPDNPGIELTDIYPKEALTCKMGTCSTKFIAIFFIIARVWKEPRCPSTEEWIQKMCTFTQGSTTQLLKTINSGNA